MHTFSLCELSNFGFHYTLLVLTHLFSLLLSSCSKMTKVHVAFLILSRGLYGSSIAIIRIETRMNFLQSCLNGVLQIFKHGSNLLSGSILAGKTILKTSFRFPKPDCFWASDRIDGYKTKKSSSFVSKKWMEAQIQS